MSPSAKVMLVEDELIVASSIAQNLQKSGYEVVGIASSSQQALAAIEQSLPDLVLMDIRIRGPVDGVQTAEQIRDRFRIPVIFMTAHADSKTLERAKIAEPFGYIVKPVALASLVTAIEIALYKNGIDRKLEQHRAWLTTTLQTSAEAMVVTDTTGRVQFLNRAAEELTGLTQVGTRGRMLDELLSITGPAGEVSSERLLERAIRHGKTTPIGRDSVLRTAKGDVSISGQIAVSRDESARPAGGVITLHDVTAERAEEQQIRQQQKMALIGHFSEGVASDFHGLLDIIHDSAKQLSLNLAKLASPAMIQEAQEQVSAIEQSAEIAMTISRQLLSLAQDTAVRPEIIDMKALVVEAMPLLRKLAGTEVDFVCECATDLGSVFGNRHHMRQLLVNLILNGKERVGEKGKIHLRFDNLAGEKAYLRMRLTADQPPDAEKAWAALTFPFQMDSPPFSLIIVSAIVTAAEGLIRSHALSETSNEVEILLPLRLSEKLARPRPTSSLKTVLAVGLKPELINLIHPALEAQGYVLLEAPSTKEALLVMGLYEGKITAVIADGAASSARSRRELKSRLWARNERAALLRFAFEEEAASDGWGTIIKPFQVSDLLEAIEIGAVNHDLKRPAGIS